MQWYDAYTRYQHENIKRPGEVHSTIVTGIVACYLGLAYSLYLLDHNAELQARLIHRPKDVGNFQGAYYELIVANILIRAGCTLMLEDETDETPERSSARLARVTSLPSRRRAAESMEVRQGQAPWRFADIPLPCGIVAPPD